VTSRIVALTGGVATGKSTVGRMLAARGATVVDADALVHRLEEPGQPTFDEIVARFGEGVLRADGSLDRGALGRLVFADRAARANLERITHPRVRALIAQQVAEAISATAPLVAVDIPLLFEAGDSSGFDGVLVVYAPESVQLQRLQTRSGLDAAEAGRRVAAQLAIDEKRDRATWVIDNSGSLEETEAQVSRWWSEVAA
jgi:dephospho-CoA kinase